MGKHETSYERIEKDLYPTPSWVVAALAEHVDLAGKVIWECTAGTGLMAEALKAAGARRIYCSDVVRRDYPLDEVLDFLSERNPKLPHFDMIVTNSAYGKGNKTAEACITRGLERLYHGQSLALLLPYDFDAAKTRHRFFRDCPAFTAKIALTKRIVWFDGPEAHPKENHWWFIWSRPILRIHRSPIILYAPKAAAK
jgi:hypothetical protein